MSVAPSQPLPELECDLVMKGGVTSGIIYPSAIAAIAEHYCFRSIGGTSAGAIGAAAAAAMEFGRRSGRNPGAREEMAALSLQLSQSDDEGRPLLARLFEPDPPRAGLFKLSMRLMEAARNKGAGGVLGVLLLWPALAALAMTLFLWALIVAGGHPSPLAKLFWGLIPLLCFPTLTLLFAAFRWLPKMRLWLAATAEGGFGFCSGMARSRSARGAESPALSEWLHEQLQSLAGLADEDPLCFGDLWAARYRTPALTREAALDSAFTETTERLDRMERDIQLSLVASDINRAQSVQLPFMRKEDALYARTSDLRQLFPPAIVSWMIEKQRRDADLDGVDLGGIGLDDLIRLPWPEHLPVLVAVRMSLSFPFLFRAVRLYVVRRRSAAHEGRELAEIWLADGGITSNFPIHLFDAPIPTRPTFCLNLLYHDDELEPDDRVPTDSAASADDEPAEESGLPMAAEGPDDLVYMLRSNSGRLSTYTRFVYGSPLGGLTRFGARVVTTARQWNDNQLIDVPGYRDRIVHIRMRSDEGGFNFAMSAPQIEDLRRRGERAGGGIARRFLPTAQDDPLTPGKPLVLNWANHRMVRLRSFLAGLEATARRFSTAWERDLARAQEPQGQRVEPSLERMVREARRSRKDTLPQHTGYPFANKEQRALALAMVDAIRNLQKLSERVPGVEIDRNRGKHTSPRPKAGMRLRPPTESDPHQNR